ncbi:hypothetical protein [Sulfitobacter sp.]|uniref:hypothetical protein n=1 Tax=Sulfitobacter sp. TaxID=1903071 RepID=UPI00300383A6
MSKDCLSVTHISITFVWVSRGFVGRKKIIHLKLKEFIKATIQSIYEASSELADDNLGLLVNPAMTTGGNTDVQYHARISQVT